jgi:uncharacterized oligopeptide transporter (OPT) family protein
MKDLMMLFALGRGQKITLSNVIFGVIGTLVFFLIIVAAGLISGYWQWAVIGAIPAILLAIALAIMIPINIRRNSNYW